MLHRHTKDIGDDGEGDQSLVGERGNRLRGCNAYVRPERYLDGIKARPALPLLSKNGEDLQYKDNLWATLSRLVGWNIKRRPSGNFAGMVSTNVIIP